jgi:hypothetical protein
MLARLLDVTIAGDTGPAALPDRDWVKRPTSTPARSSGLPWSSATSHVAARTAPAKEVTRDGAAAADPAVWPQLRDDDQRRDLTHQALPGPAIGGDSPREGCDRDTCSHSLRDGQQPLL